MAATASRHTPVRTRTRVIRERASAMGRRAGAAALATAREEKHTFTALAAAAALGYARRENMLDGIPQIDAIGTEGTLALVAFGVGKFLKSKVASHVATGLGCVAINRLAAGDLGGSST